MSSFRHSICRRRGYFARNVKSNLAAIGRHIRKYQGELNVKSPRVSQRTAERNRAVFALLARLFSRVLSAAHLNFYSGADRLTDELTDSVGVDTAPKESRARGSAKGEFGRFTPDA